MRTLWMVSVTFVLVSILPSCRPTDEFCEGFNFTRENFFIRWDIQLYNGFYLTEVHFQHTASQCNVAVCKERGRRRCVLLRCYTEYDQCGGKTCNLTEREICLNNTCVENGENCWNSKGFWCSRKGLSCGDGQFCEMNAKCINGRCYKIDIICVGGGDGTKCGSQYGGTCSDGVCLTECGKSWYCPCMKDGDKYCTRPKCEETFCW